MEFSQFFEEFMPHGMCYSWNPYILFLNVGSDALIAAAYFCIPVALYYFFRHKKDFPFRKVILMFCVFIFTCGLSHLMGIWTVWNGSYGVQGLVKGATALASVATAAMLIPLMPQLMALRSPKALEGKRDDQSRFPIEVSLSSVGTAGQDLYSVAIRDMTGRNSLARQTRALEQQIAHVNRLDTMGQLAVGLAHEINQPLTALTQNADSAMIWAEQQGVVDPDLREILEDIEAQAHRAGDIIRALRQFANNDDTSREAFDLTMLLKQTLRLVDVDAKKYGVEIRNEIPAGTMVFGARVQIAQVFVNLLRNSIEAMVEFETEEPLILVRCDWTDQFLSLSVKDNGPGVVLEQDIFTPFQSRKADGMGMGLSICRSIVEGHGGAFSIDRTVETGAHFKFTLPKEKI